MPSVITEPRRELRPHPGSQEAFLSCPADIAIGGGGAGGGKTFGLLLEPLRHVERVRNFGAVIFRRIMPSVTNEGGMWDQSYTVYPDLGAVPVESPRHHWRFPLGTTVTFSHLQHERDKLSWAGAQIPLLEFDQLEEFEASQFWYLWSRARTACGVAPYVRASVNPVPADDPVGGWVHHLIQWWLHPETGLAIPERSGVLRWFVRQPDDSLAWFDTQAAALTAYPQSRPTSLTFIRMLLHENVTLEQQDPAYRAKLEALPRVERERLLGGNWNVRAVSGLLLDRAWFDILPAWPADARGYPVQVTQRVRYWDKAGTEGGGRYSAGVRLSRTTDGVYLIEDVERGQWSAENRERVILQCARLDPAGTAVWHEQEPGSGGKESAELTTRRLAGYDVRADRVTGSKIARSAPFRAQAEARSVKLLPGAWNEAFLRECHAWSGDPSEVCDQIDAAAGAFTKLALGVGTGGMVKVRGL